MRAVPPSLRLHGRWPRATAIALLMIGLLGRSQVAHAAMASATASGMKNARASDPSQAGPTAPAASAVAAEPPTTEPGSPASASPDIAQAARDFERGETLLGSKKGAGRLAPAESAFTAAIDRLAPSAETLDHEGLRILARALDARAQTRLLRGRAKAADSDFERLVTLDPAYEPDAKTPKKVLDRYHKIRAPRIGFVTLKVDPPEAAILWNGRDLGPASGLQAERPVLAGPYTVRARRDCYEEKEATGEIAAAEKKAVVLTLDAFARLVRFETSPAGFDVDIDGTLAGRTEVPKRPSPSQGGTGAMVSEGAGPEAPPSPEGAVADEPDGRGPSGSSTATAVGNGVLELACLAAGDHTYTVRRECYADVRGTLTVEIDMLDKTPIVVPLMTPEKRETRLSVTSDTPGASLFIDGAPAGPLPVRDKRLCAPRATMEARVKDRVIWRQTRDLPDGPLDLTARRRPTLVFTLQEDEGATADESLKETIRERMAGLESFNVEGPVSIAPTELDFAVDLVLRAHLMGGDGGDATVELELTPPTLPRLALHASCSVPRGAGSDPCLDKFFDQLDAAWSPSGNRTGEGKGPPGISPPGVLAVPLPRAIAAALLDASVLAPGADRNATLMTLSSALIGAGAYREALDQSLERQEWADVPGPTSRGTAAFLSGICHQALGEQDAALNAFRRAAADPKATLWTSDGIPVAPLARLMLPITK